MTTSFMPAATARRRMLASACLAAVVAVAACRDGGTDPARESAEMPAASASALAPALATLDDARERILPAVADGSLRAALRGALAEVRTAVAANDAERVLATSSRLRRELAAALRAGAVDAPDLSALAVVLDGVEGAAVAFEPLSGSEGPRT